MQGNFRVLNIINNSSALNETRFEELNVQYNAKQSHT